MASAARAWLVLLVLAPWAAAEDVAALAAQLNSDRAHEAADRLAELGPAAKNAVPQLIGALQSEDPELRWRAAWALSRIGRDAAPAAAALVIVAQRDEVLPAGAAQIALKRIGGAATDAVLAAMHQAPEENRATYLPLLRTVEPKPDQMVPVLLPFLDHPDERNMWLARDILVSMGPGAALAAPVFVRLLKEDQFAVSTENALVAIGEPSVAPLRELAMDTKASPDARAQAIGLLARIGGLGAVAAKDCLRAAVLGGAWKESLETFAKAGPMPPEIAPLLEERIAREQDVPPGTVAALLSMGPPGETVLERILFDSPSVCRMLLTLQLQRAGSSKAIAWLFRLAGPSEPRWVRVPALIVLADSRLDADQSRRAATLVECSLKDEAASACALAANLGPAALPLVDRLRPLLEDRDPWVQASAASAILRIGKGGDAEVSILARVVENAETDPDGSMYGQALRYLADAGLPAAANYELLLDALPSKDATVAYAATEGLARMLPALGTNKGRVLAALQDEPYGFWNGVNAMDDVATLIELLSVKWAAAAATRRLVALGSHAWEPLVGALDAPDRNARTSAAQALLRIDAEKAGDRAWTIALATVHLPSEVRDVCRERVGIAIPNLMKTLSCSDSLARAGAAELLGQLNCRGAAQALHDLLAHDTKAIVRWRAMWALDAVLATQ